MFTHEHVTMQGTFACEYISMQGMLKPEHVTLQSMLTLEYIFSRQGTKFSRINSWDESDADSDSALKFDEK